MAQKDDRITAEQLYAMEQQRRAAAAKKAVEALLERPKLSK